MFGMSFAEGTKKARFVSSFLRKQLVHTNLQLLYDCNFHCQICDYWKKPYTAMPRLTLQDIQVIASKLNQVGPQVISIGGGEPLLHPDIVRIVESLSVSHFPVMICNGWFVTPENARALFEAGMYEISVSVDYIDPQKHDDQRGVPGAWDRAVEALRVLQQNRVRADQRVHMISVVMEDNLQDIEPLIKLCRDIDVTYLVTLYSSNRGRKRSANFAADVSQHLRELKEKYREFVVLRGYIGNFTRAVREEGIGPCYTGLNLCNIDSTGAVSLCIDRHDESIGNILTDKMSHIVHGLRRKHRHNSCCECWTSCRGAIESLMYGDQSLGNFYDYFQLTKDRPVALAPRPRSR